MNKVSKGIKRLRIKNGFTQDALAEKLNVSRQTISSWETDRTQPDIDMLVSISEVLGSPVEELIYGEKRNVGLESSRAKYHSAVTVIFAVLGSLLIGSGLIMIFVTYWGDFPFVLKTVFSFLPLVLTQSFGIYVIKRQRKSTAFSESAAALWTVGIISTVALVNSVFGLSSGYITCLIIDCILTLPVVFILNAASPLVFIYYAVCHWSISLCSDHELGIPETVMAVLIFGAAALFTYFSREFIDDIRKVASKWLAVISGMILIGTFAATAEFDFVIIALILGFSIAFLLYREEKILDPFYFLGITGITVMSVVCSYLGMGGVFADFENFMISDYLQGVILLLILIAVIITLIVLNAKKPSSRPKIIFSSLTVALSVIWFSYLFFDYKTLSSFALVGRAVSFAIGVLLLVFGAKRVNFLFVNLGFLSVSAQIILICMELDFELLEMGLVCILLGGVLLAVNFKLIKDRKKAILLQSKTAEVNEDA